MPIDRKGEEGGGRPAALPWWVPCRLPLRHIDHVHRTPGNANTHTQPAGHSRGTDENKRSREFLSAICPVASSTGPPPFRSSLAAGTCTGLLFSVQGKKKKKRKKTNVIADNERGDGQSVDKDGPHSSRQLYRASRPVS